MKLIYIAGPYRGKTPAHIQANINDAWETGRQLILKMGKHGYFPVIPHLNTQHYDGLQSDDYFLSGTAELLRRCDAMLVIGWWTESKGTLEEIKLAESLKIPVYYSLDEIYEAKKNENKLTNMIIRNMLMDAKMPEYMTYKFGKHHKGD